MTRHEAHFSEYEVLSADSAEALSEKVMHAIRNHWQPYGDMTVAVTRSGAEERVQLLQPMVQQTEWFR